MGPAIATAYDALITGIGERLLGGLRQRAVAGATGTVLEIGGGTGANLPHYGPRVETLVLTDPDPAMLGIARRHVSRGSGEHAGSRVSRGRRADRARWTSQQAGPGRVNQGQVTGRRILLCRCRAEALPFRTAVFDSVVSGLTLCTVDDLSQSLAEARRVLRPGGRLRFVEHVRPEGALGLVFDVVTPAWKRVTAGCHLNRCTLEAIRAAGFSLQGIAERRVAGVPLVAGDAVKP